MLVIGFALGAGLRYYLTWILQRVNQHLRLAMMDSAVHLSLRRRDNRQAGDAIYRVYQDSAMVTSVVRNALIAPVVALFNLLAAAGAVSFFSPYLGLLFLIAAVPALLLAWRFTPQLRTRSAKARTANSELTSHIQESVGGARLLKACRAESRALDVFRDRSAIALDRAYELRRAVAVLGLLVYLCAALAALVADYLMVRWVWDEAATFGYGVVAFIGFAVWNLGAFQAAQESFAHHRRHGHFLGRHLVRAARHERRPQARLPAARRRAGSGGQAGRSAHARARRRRSLRERAFQLPR